MKSSRDAQKLTIGIPKYLKSGMPKYLKSSGDAQELTSGIPKYLKSRDAQVGIPKYLKSGDAQVLKRRDAQGFGKWGCPTQDPRHLGIPKWAAQVSDPY